MTTHRIVLPYKIGGKMDIEEFPDDIKAQVWAALREEPWLSQQVEAIAFNSFPFLIVQASGMRYHFTYDVLQYGLRSFIGHLFHWLHTGERGDDGTKYPLQAAPSVAESEDGDNSSQVYFTGWNPEEPVNLPPEEPCDCPVCRGDMPPWGEHPAMVAVWKAFKRASLEQQCLLEIDGMSIRVGGIIEFRTTLPRPIGIHFVRWDIGDISTLEQRTYDWLMDHIPSVEKRDSGDE